MPDRNGSAGRRRASWLALAALLLVAAAALMALVEEPVRRPRARVDFPNQMREVEQRRAEGRRTLPPSAAAPRPRADQDEAPAPRRRHVAIRSSPRCRSPRASRW